jgi:predicted ArsR family transcriptional regulator
MPDTKRQAKMLPTKLAALLVALREGEYNCKELAEMADLHYLTVLDYCRALHEAGLIHIAKYERDALGRASVVVFKLGEGEDAVKPRLTRAEQQKNYRRRLKLRTGVIF